MDIISNRIGVPSLVEEDGTVIYLTHAEIDNLTAIDLDDPTVIDRIYDSIKVAVSNLAPIDPDLGIGDWVQKYNEFALINEFQTALFVLNQARMAGDRYREEIGDE